MKDLTDAQLKMAWTAIDDINKDLVEIMKKLGTDSRYVYLHPDATSTQNNILKEYMYDGSYARRRGGARQQADTPGMPMKDPADSSGGVPALGRRRRAGPAARGATAPRLSLLCARPF